MTIRSVGERAAHTARRSLLKIAFAADRAGVEQPLSRRVSDAHHFWTVDENSAWAQNSHWRDGLGEDAWLEVGKDHVAIYEQFAKALDIPLSQDVVIEWGCGGGAIAVAFAPMSKRFIGADVSAKSLSECKRQVEAACNTPIETLLIDIANPEHAIAGREESCDLFLCHYVLEATAGPEEALRIIRIAERLLVAGGMAFVQVKYHTADARTRRSKRNYRRNVAIMATFEIDEFWLRAAECGLTPRLITLVPENRLDSRYAYYALTKPPASEP